MNLQVIAQEFSVTPSLRAYLERRVYFAFARARGRMVRIVVRLRDLNGPRGGPDKVCQVCVVMPGQPEVVIRDVQADMYKAIDCAVKRVAYHAMRIVTRKRPAVCYDIAALRRASPNLPEGAGHG